MEEFAANLNTGLFLMVISLGILIFIVLEVGRYLAPILLKNTKVADIVIQYFPLAELAILTAYFVWTIPFILKHNKLMGFGMIVFGLIILLFISWFLVKDVIAGMIFRSTKNVQKGKEIETIQSSGKIERLGLRQMILKTDQDNLVHIPYSKILQGEFKIKSSTTNLQKLQFTCELNSDLSAQQVINKLQKSILLMPWVPADEQANITILSKENQKYLVQIGLFALSADYFQLIEKQIKEDFDS
jgi:small-conductance mechanosensitive channel